MSKTYDWYSEITVPILGIEKLHPGKIIMWGRHYPEPTLGVILDYPYEHDGEITYRVFWMNSHDEGWVTHESLMTLENSYEIASAI